MKQHQPTKAMRLTESDRSELRHLRESKPWLWSYGALAEHFGCSRWTATDICKETARNDLDAAMTTFAALACQVQEAAIKEAA